MPDAVKIRKFWYILSLLLLKEGGIYSILYSGRDTILIGISY